MNLASRQRFSTSFPSQQHHSSLPPVKMLFSTQKAAGFLAFAALTLPQVYANCLSYYDANTLATNFGKLISSYSGTLANQTLSANFQYDYSESVNTLIDNGGTAPQALLDPTFTSRAGFESASADQPSVPFAVQDIWYTCNTITVRWLSAQTPQPVVGISVLGTIRGPNRNPSKYQINKIWAEFDSGAWLVNLGIFTPAKKEKKREIAFEA